MRPRVGFGSKVRVRSGSESGLVTGDEPTFSTELRQVGGGLLVRRPQHPQSPASGFQAVHVPRSGDGRVRGSLQLLKRIAFLHMPSG